MPDVYRCLQGGVFSQEGETLDAKKQCKGEGPITIVWEETTDDDGNKTRNIRRLQLQCPEHGTVDVSRDMFQKIYGVTV